MTKTPNTRREYNTMNTFARLSTNYYAPDVHIVPISGKHFMMAQMTTS